MKKILIVLTASALALTVSAQNVTYNHDSAKKNQIMVMETGGGSLTPELYYTLLHNSYKKTAASKNKLGFRTTAGIGAYQQVDEAEAIDSALTARAKIEALNVADRQIDLAWRVEGQKVTDMMTKFRSNIDKVMQSGGSLGDKQRWEEYYSVYNAAISATRTAYLPNAQRKKEYLRIYTDVAKNNEVLVKQLTLFANKNKTSQLLSATATYQKANKSDIISTASGKWKSAGMDTRGNSNSQSDDDGDGDESVNR